MKKASGFRKKLLTVRVHPGSRLTRVEKLAEDEYRVHVLSPPEKGRANRDVAAALADYFGLPAGRVRIVRGERSRVKFVALEADE
ncbi:MAG TPA: DUF167 domain-containing protein [Candidatus Desulfaltia sp.]|nr:DUF167 domain-containing protein [Candidatus Desulfaltia sp.]